MSKRAFQPGTWQAAQEARLNGTTPDNQASGRQSDQALFRRAQRDQFTRADVVKAERERSAPARADLRNRRIGVLCVLIAVLLGFGSLSGAFDMWLDVAATLTNALTQHS